MDANKLTVLKEIGYTVHRTCGSCIHAKFSRGAQWSTCEIYTYQHQKHTGEARQLSIHVSGECQSWENESFGDSLEGFYELLEVT